jgi:hypothetical protein
VANATVKERKSIAAYIYKRAASLQSTWRDIENEEILRILLMSASVQFLLGYTNNRG